MSDESIEDFLARHERLRRERLERLNASPVVQLIGLVGASPPGGAHSNGEEDWECSFSLVAWKVAGRPHKQTELRIQQRVSHEQLQRLMKEIQPYDILRANVRMFETPDMVYGLLISAVEKISDSELLEVTQSLQRPVVIKDTELGEFVLNRKVNWFTGTPNWNGKKISLHLTANSTEAAAEILKFAKSMWASQETWDKKFRDCAVRSLLKLKNSAWLDDDEKELTPLEFSQKMKYSSIGLDPDGSLSVYFDDGDMFLGHAIVVTGSISNGPKRAEIVG